MLRKAIAAAALITVGILAEFGYRVVGGNFSGTVHFGDPNNLGGEDVTSVGSSEAYLVKYDRDGNQLWVQQMGGPAGGLGGMYQVGRAVFESQTPVLVVFEGWGTAGKGRVFHCVLGHDVKALAPDAVGELFRRGTAWTAGLTPVAGAK